METNSGARGGEHSQEDVCTERHMPVARGGIHNKESGEVGVWGVSVWWGLEPKDMKQK